MSSNFQAGWLKSSVARIIWSFQRAHRIGKLMRVMDN